MTTHSAPLRPLAAPFNLRRWFAVVALLAIALISAASATLLSRFLTDRMLRQEGILTTEFIQSVIMVERASELFRADIDERAKEIRGTFEHVAKMPDVLRANVYAADRKVIWSSDEALVGKQFTDNSELEEALAGEVVVHGERLKHGDKTKGEHADLDSDVGFFVEIYSPVRDEASGRVIGVVELYKHPQALFEAISDGERLIWGGAAAAGVILFAALFGMVLRADNVIQAQQSRLVESETLAAVGEMGTAVAHGIRNPLASIRSSAELMAEVEGPDSRESARDIIAETDRLEQWVRDLLTFARPLSGQIEPIDILSLVRGSLSSFERDLDRRRITATASLPESLPKVRADAMLMGQVLHNLLANAVEAVGQSGAIEVRASNNGARQVSVTVRDTGPGMSPDQLRKVFKPFFTTKPKGMGVGLALSKRIVERFGGRISIESELGRGTTVEVILPAG